MFNWLTIPYAYAQSIPLINPLGSNTSFLSVMNAIFAFLFTDVAVPLCAIMVLVGAFQMMTAGGDPEKFSNGRKTLMYAAIGFAVALIAIGATSIIKSIISPGS